MEKSLISGEKVNCSRQGEIDLLKAYPILFMVIIHVYENLSIGRIDAAPHTWAEHLLQFLAGPATAPAFMFAMGVGIVYSGKSTPAGLLKRGLTLFVGGYILNAARSGILTTIGMALTGRFDLDLIKYLFLNADIFHFAGLALMLSALFLQMKLRPVAIAGISLLMQLVGRCFAGLPEMTGDLGYITGQFYKCTWVCCFPLLQWYVYPALGHRILVAHEAHAGAGVLRLVDVHLYDVAEDAEVGVQVFRLNLRDVERAFALRQARHVGVEDVEQGASGWSVPCLFVEHDQHLVGSSAGLREDLLLRAAGQEQQAEEEQKPPPRSPFGGVL